MITDEQAEKAADFIRDNSEAFATAKANRIYCEEYRKSLKAIIAANSEGTVAARDNLAYSDPRYLEHLQELKNAVFQEEKLKGLISAAHAKIECWRSLSANNRGKI